MYNLKTVTWEACPNAFVTRLVKINPVWTSSGVYGKSLKAGEAKNEQHPSLNWTGLVSTSAIDNTYFTTGAIPDLARTKIMYKFLKAQEKHYLGI